MATVWLCDFESTAGHSISGRALLPFLVLDASGSTTRKHKHLCLVQSQRAAQYLASLRHKRCRAWSKVKIPNLVLLGITGFLRFLSSWQCCELPTGRREMSALIAMPALKLARNCSQNARVDSECLTCRRWRYYLERYHGGNYFVDHWTYKHMAVSNFKSL